MSTDLSRAAVVVGLDLDGSSDSALDWATDDASRRHRPLHLIAVGEPRYPDVMAGAIAMEPVEVDVSWVLDQAEARVRERAPGLAVRRTSARSRPLDVLVEASRSADSVVVGSHGRSRLGSLLLGSVSLQVAAQATCPVVVVRRLPDASAPEQRARVVVGVDGSPVSQEAVGYAFQQADARGLPLTVVHAWHPETAGESGAPPEERWRRAGEMEVAVTSEAVTGWREKFPDVEVHSHVVRRSPVDALVADTDGAELLVVGSRGWGDVRGLLLGSVSQGVLRRAACPVAIVRPHAAPTAP